MLSQYELLMNLEGSASHMYKWFLNIKQKVFGLNFFENNLAFEKLFASNSPLGVSSDFTKLRLTLFFYPTSLSISTENVAFFFDILHQITWKYLLLYVLHMLGSSVDCLFQSSIEFQLSLGKKYSIDGIVHFRQDRC